MDIDRRLIYSLAGLMLIAACSVMLAIWLLAHETGASELVELVVEEELETVQKHIQASTRETPPADPTRFYSQKVVDGVPAPRCPARLVVLDDGGRPVSGAAKIGLPPDVWVDLDASGSGVWTARYCDARQSIHLRLTDGSRLHRRVDFEDGDEVVLTLSTTQVAWVQPVDADGQPIDAEVRPGKRLDDGRYEVRARSETAYIEVALPGEHGHSVVIDLDDTIHEIEVFQDRSVVVHLHCDQCSGALACDTGTMPPRSCVGEDTLYSCPCPQTDATLWLRTPNAVRDYVDLVQPLAVVASDAEAVSVDVRGEPGTVRVCGDAPTSSARWATLRRPGTGPVSVSLRDPAPDESCVEFNGILPGAWIVAVHRGGQEDALHPVDLPSAGNQEVRLESL